MRSDQECKYKNKEFKKLVDKENIDHILTYYETRANFAERVIKTIKLKIFKYFTNRETFRWIDILSDLTNGYNNSIHRSIKISPQDAQSSDPNPKFGILLNHRKQKLAKLQTRKFIQN